MSDLIDRDYMLSQIEKAKTENRPFDYDSLIDFVKVLPNANKAELESIKAELLSYEADCQITADTQTCMICTADTFKSIEHILDKHIKEIDNES